MQLPHNFTLICSYSHGRLSQLSKCCFSLVSSHPVLTGPDLAYIGSRVTFLCHAPDSSPPITYDLLKDGDVPVAVNVVYKGNQSVLFFLKVTATLEGSYHCRATAGGRTGLSNSVQLSVASECNYLPTASDSLSHPYLSRHSSATVKHQSVFRTLPARRVRGITLRAELQRHQRLAPVLHLVFQQA